VPQSPDELAVLRQQQQELQARLARIEEKLDALSTTPDQG